ncbi:unnamed protein product, partial [Discosporangium mesarthrocarpum]
MGFVTGPLGGASQQEKSNSRRAREEEGLALLFQPPSCWYSCQEAGERMGEGIKRLVPEVALCKSVCDLDLRGKLAGVLSLVGFDQSTTNGLGPHEVKALFMAMQFLDFRAAEAWQKVGGREEGQDACLFRVAHTASALMYLAFTFE